MPNTIGDRIRGHIVHVDKGAHRRRIVWASGPDVIQYHAEPHHFPVAGTDSSLYTTTMVEAGAGGDSDVNPSNTAGAIFEVVTDNAENDGVSMQLLGESYELTTDHDLYCGIRMKINDVDQSDFFFGLAITDTAILGGVTDRIGFESADESADVAMLVEKDSTQTASSAVATMVDDTYIELEFYWDGGASTLTTFVDGAEVTSPATTNLPDDEALRLSLEFLTGETTAQTMTVQWMRVVQIGR